MSRISNLLAQILSSVYGRDVRQAIHDSIEECYGDVTNGVTLAEEAADAATASVTAAVASIDEAVTEMQTDTNAAIASCNAAAATALGIVNKSVRFDSSQSLTGAQKTQARENIGIWYGTQNEYDSISVKDPNVEYNIYEDSV